MTYKYLLILLFINTSFVLLAQSTITGEVKNDKGEPVAIVSVYLKGTTEATTTDTGGRFTLTTNLKGEQIVMASALGIKKMSHPVVLADSTYIVNFQIAEDVTKLDEYVLSATGSEADNDRSIANLDPIEIVTTAGAQGDIIGALQTLPGVQRNGGDQTGLMVRGGDVNESVVIIDGTTSQNAFNSTVPGVAQRSRFNPFQFKGTAFSTGGYSVRYGQALSSVLDLQTNDLAEKDNVNVGGNFAGVYLAGEKLLGKNSIDYSGYYNNLSPFFLTANTNVDFYEVPQGGGLSTRFVSKTDNNGIFKMGLSHTFNKTGIAINNPAVAGETMNFGIKNQNTYLTTSFKNWINERVRYNTAFSFSNNTDNISWGDFSVYRNDSRVQGRAELYYEAGNKFNLLGGAEVQSYSYTQQFDTLMGQFSELLSAVYVEAEYKPAKWFAVKPGVRAEYSQLIARGNAAPRLAVAFKPGAASQISLASGMFYQTAAVNYLLFGYRPKFQQAIHYMLNYQRIKDNRTFRVEGYYKSYDQLVREKGIAYNPNAFRFNFGEVDNSGDGYAQGLDFFWRDKKSIKNFDYWVSYSYIDTKRLYKNYESKVTPDYVSTHNLSVIAKLFVDRLQTNFSASYSYASGRPYYDPNSTRFLSDKAPDFHNLALTISYLTTIRKMFTVIYLSVDNITNQKNILGYRYSLDGQDRYPVLPAIYRSFFLGVNFSLSEFNKDEL